MYFSFHSKTMKFKKLKYHIIFLRQAEVQGFEGFGNSILLQFSFIQGNWYYNPQEKKNPLSSNIWAPDNHLLLRQKKCIMKPNCNRCSKDKRRKIYLVATKKKMQSLISLVRARFFFYHPDDTTSTPQSLNNSMARDRHFTLNKTF